VDAKEVEVEVLPPDKGGRKEGNEIAGLLAWVLDDLIGIPGTKYRIGLDPILAFIPGVGDMSASAMGTLILLQAFRRNVPKIVIARMAINIFINALIGVVPGLGNFLSAIFKSNRRNFALLERHGRGPRQSTTGDWIFMWTLLALMLVGVIGVAFLSVFILSRLLHLLFS
jgi:Domain of unknown function (DUF4112)